MNKEYSKWENTRDKGKLRFVLLTGVLGYGIPMLIAMSFVTGGPLAHGFSVKSVVIHMAIWLTAGALFGEITWRILDYRYKKFVSAQEKR